MQVLEFKVYKLLIMYPIIFAIHGVSQSNHALQDDEPSAATAALEAAYPEMNRKNKNKKKGGHVVAAAPTVPEPGTPN